MRFMDFEHHPRLLQVAFILVAALVAVVGIPADAHASKSASMVIDANTGKVLHASKADEPRYPASLTKLMTLYLVFEEIERERLSLDSKVRMTAWAASAPPSKLGLKPGEEITVRDAIRALVTKSANDVARALAEHIGGSEEAFARMMTEKARLLGMSKTTFRNASGLPDLEQVTTARDMLTLALYLYDNFEKHYHFFSTTQFTFRGRTYRNHNTLLRTYPGMDGLKTGYIRLSGYNLVSSVRRGGKHVVAAVFGGQTAASRNAQMRALLNRTLPKASTKKTRKPEVVSFYRATPPAPVSRPAPRITTPPPIPVMAASATAEDGAPVVTASAGPLPNISIAKVRPVAVISAAPSSGAVSDEKRASPSQAQIGKGIALGRQPSTLQAQAEMLARANAANASVGLSGSPTSDASRPISLAKADLRPPQPVPAALTPAAPRRTEAQKLTSDYQIQVGAYGSVDEAQKALIAALEKAHTLLAEAAPVTVPVRSGARQLFRARFVGFDPQAARSTCEELRRQQIDCFVTKAE